MADRTPVINQESACRLYLEELESKRENPEFRALPLFLNTYQEALDYLRLEELTIVGGYEGHGKSVFANDIAFSLADYFRQDTSATKRQVLLATVEMNYKQVINRFITRLVGIPVGRLVTPDMLNEKELEQVKKAVDTISDYRINYLDSAFISLESIENKIQDLAVEGPVRLVVVDYLQLLKDCADGSRQATDAAAQTLKEFARRYTCHVICVSNLNRNTDTPGFVKEPTSMNLRNSQGIANAADNILFVWRPEVIDPDLCPPHLKGGVQLTVAKQRNGKTGKYVMDWNGSKMTFQEPTGSRLNVPTQPYKLPSYSIS